MPEAEHAETDPGASLRLIAPLACSLVERSDEILLTEGGQFRRAYFPRVAGRNWVSASIARDCRRCSSAARRSVFSTTPSEMEATTAREWLLRRGVL
jgi:hypothetical protein